MRTALTIVEKSSSVRIIAAASFETSVPVIPIAMPMSARFSAGASLTPSPVIATTCTSPLERVDEPHLVLGRDARDDADAVDRGQRLVVAHRGPLRAGDGASLDSELSGDRLGRDRVVAGDHAHSDPRGLRLGDRRLRLRTRRVDDADEREHRQAVDEREQVRLRDRTWRDRSPSAPSRARAGPARRAACSRPCSAAPKSSSAATGCSSGIERERAAREQLVGRALDEAADDVLPVLVLHLGGRSPSACRRSRTGDRRRAGTSLRVGGRVEASLLREHDDARPRSGRRSARRRSRPRPTRAATGAGTARAATSGCPATRLIVPSVE